MPRGNQKKPFASYNPDHEDSSSSDEEEQQQQQQQQPSKRKRESKSSRSKKKPNAYPDDDDDDVHVSFAAAAAAQKHNPAAAYTKQLQVHKEQLDKQVRRLERQARRQAQAAAPPAAAAAALPPPPPELDPLLETLLQHFRQLYAHNNADGSNNNDNDEEIPHVDLDKARNVLEATAGNVPMAVQLYWDDHFATAAAQASAVKKILQQEEKQQQHAESALDNNGVGGGDDDDDDGMPHRRVRRSLDRDFGRAADQPEEDEDDDDDDMEDEDEGEDEEDDDENAVAARDQNERQQNQHQQQNQNQEQQLIVDALAGQQARRLLRVEMGESVSVSDDEGGGAGAGVWGIVGRMVGQLEDEEASPPIPPPPRRRLTHPSQNSNNNNNVVRRIQEAAIAVTKKVIPRRPPVEEETTEKKRKPPLETQDEDADDYISDSDWLEDEAASTLPAFDFLWGKGEPTSTSSASSASSAVNENGGGGGGGEGNVIADEDAEEESSSGSGIPHTWLNASFSLSSCSTGLAAKPPKAEDVELFVWRQQQNGSDRNGRNALPPPHHCKAITGLLSMVTAMLYTGASIQGDEVNCTSAKIPFAELVEEERKRQFESRLADALSALIFVAAKASQDRKKRALRKALATKGSDIIKTQTMQRKLRLLPTCCWEDEVASGLSRPPDGPLYQPVQLTTSYTNIGDIRVYVLSSMRHFTARGGVALLLETILRIHGKGVLARMMQKARTEAKLPDDATTTKSLIACTCEERQKKVQEDKPLPPSERNDTTKLMDMTPDGTECVTVELLSLILTGKMYSNWKGWSAKGLGFGILTNKPSQVGWQLARPEKPVWILQGETCYSVLMLEGSSKGYPTTACTISKLDRPGAVLQLTHWNCWYEQRNKSGLRLTTAAAKWKPPMANKLRAAVDLNKPKHMSEILLERRRQQRTNIVSADEHEANEEQDRESHITLEEIERCTPNPDDKRFYADKYRMWQFDMGRIVQEDDIIMEEDAKPRAEQWIPYHRLTDRQKLLVELKLGPKINTILWTRWPRATIDNFTPDDGPLPIV